VRTLIWGAGAIGGTLGAYLARSGRDVTMVDIDVDHVKTIARAGIRITGPIDECAQSLDALDALAATDRHALLP
jgi:2-dehydropantoate 2-reductase